MSDLQFYQTRAGRTFYESTMPALVAELARLNALLEKLVEHRDAERIEPSTSCSRSRCANPETEP